MVTDLKDIVIITLGGLSSALGILFTAAVYRKKNAAETFEKTAAGKKNEADAFKITIETTMSVGELYKREFKELKGEFDILKQSHKQIIDSDMTKGKELETEKKKYEELQVKYDKVIELNEELRKENKALREDVKKLHVEIKDNKDLINQYLKQ